MNKSIRTEIVINASKEKVWNILTNFDNYPQWNPFIISIKGELAKGKRLTNTLLNGSKKFLFKPVVLSVIPLRSFDWLGSFLIKGIFDGHHYFEIETLGGGQVKLSHGESFSGILSSYIFRKIGNKTRDSFVRMNEALKQLAEKI